jgi:hypothetical protein
LFPKILTLPPVAERIGGAIESMLKLAVVLVVVALLVVVVAAAVVVVVAALVVVVVAAVVVVVAPVVVVAAAVVLVGAAVVVVAALAAVVVVAAAVVLVVAAVVPVAPVVVVVAAALVPGLCEMLGNGVESIVVHGIVDVVAPPVPEVVTGPEVVESPTALLVVVVIGRVGEAAPTLKNTAWGLPIGVVGAAAVAA